MCSVTLSYMHTEDNKQWGISFAAQMKKIKELKKDFLAPFLTLIQLTTLEFSVWVPSG